MQITSTIANSRHFLSGTQPDKSRHQVSSTEALRANGAERLVSFTRSSASELTMGQRAALALGDQPSVFKFDEMTTVEA
ncbi:hypothetical protein BaRGS_00013291 [Batillaria attramentaria]|uniref:Uncharacterized protein n=1 Tax=Batillaria attramentaria TaxID=370345 RepID=A0ABD0L7J7_9CAEN